MTNEVDGTPFFSVCIPTYNTANYIGEAIQIVLEQTFTDYEIVISDNCSTDNTKEIVDSFKSSKISYYLNDKNIGLYPNVTLTVQRAKGKYVQILCADDKLSPYCLETIYQQIALRDFSVGGVGTEYSTNVDDFQTEKLSDSFDYKVCTVGIYNFFDYINQKSDANLGGLLGTICARKDLLSEIGYFGNDVNSLASDVITWKKIVLSTNCILIDKPILFYYRFHANQVGVLNPRKLTMSEYFQFFKDYRKVLSSLDVDGRETKKFLNARIVDYFAKGISKGIQQKNFSFFSQVLKITNGYGCRIPIILILNRYFTKILNRYFSFN